jgi:hypothetical protein
MDVQRVSLRFDPTNEADRKLVARLYRDARVVQHVETGDLISLEADVPRRLVEELAGRGAGGGR